MFHRPARYLGYGLLSVLMLSFLTGCQTLSEALRANQTPAPATVTPAEPATAAPAQPAAAIQKSKPKPCPKPRTITRKVTVYTPVKVGNKQLFGEAEMSNIPALSLRLPARIDTGARTTSLHATQVELFERDGKNWVRFQSPNGAKTVTQELPLKRKVRIKRKDKGVVERPVVELKVQIGDVVQRLDVNLADRSHLEYPVLIGRDFLQDLVIVDVSKSYIADQPEDRPKSEATR